MTQLIGGNGRSELSNGGFNNVTFKYNSTTADDYLMKHLVIL